MLSALYPERLAPAEAAAAGPRAWEQRYLVALLTLAVSYQLWLAFAHTQLGLGGRGVVVAAEVLMVAAALPLVLRRLPLALCLIAALLFANALLLALARGAFDPKPLRDVLVPLVFLWVGMNSAGPAAAERVLRAVIWVVLAVALFEFLYLEGFTSLFDIQSYYVARGAADPEMALYRDDKLVASGLRPEGIGRTILPFLGPHRVSSAFIEPVSFGNFAVICAAWGLAKPREKWREALFFVAVAALMLVLNDSRFGLVSIALLLALRLALPRGAEPAAVLFPFACAATLVAIALATGGEYSDTFAGRLSLTGETLMKMNLPDYLGLVAPRYGYYDMGYPYILANFGLVAVLLLWGAYWLLPITDETGRRFQAYVAVYLALILCVSGTSVFAFKTSALLWFLAGSFAAALKET